MKRPDPSRADEIRIERELRGVVRRHFAASGRTDDFSGDGFLEWLGDELLRNAWENPYSFQVFEKPNALAALDRIDHALQEIGNACAESEMHILDRLFAEMALGAIGLDGGKAWLQVSRNSSGYRSAVQNFRRKLEADPLGKRTLSQFKAANMGLVGGCRLVWLYATGKPAPVNDLNRASKFAKFLADVIKACGLDGDEVSAFRAWVREQRENP